VKGPFKGLFLWSIRCIYYSQKSMGEFILAILQTSSIEKFSTKRNWNAMHDHVPFKREALTSFYCLI
jgi:hypothetical protein